MGALLLEGVGAGFEAAAVGVDVVGGVGEWGLLGSDGGEAEVEGEGVEGHLRGAGLAVGTVAGDVGRGETGHRQETGIGVRLVFPDVDDGLTDLPVGKGVDEGVGVGDGTSRGIDEERAAAQRGEEGLIGQMVGGTRAVGGEGNMEGDDVGIPQRVGG